MSHWASADVKSQLSSVASIHTLPKVEGGVVTLLYKTCLFLLAHS